MKASPPSPPPNAKVAPLKIVVADDHEIVRDGLRRIIRDRPGWEVSGEAASGSEAEELAARLRPDLIILDLGLVGFDGIEAARRISRRVPKCKILIFTALASPDSVRRAFRAGAHGYFLKTESDAELARAIEAVSRGERYMSPTVEKVAVLDYLENEKENNLPLLTRRERETIALIARGQSNKEVAVILGISIKTVETHRAAAMNKLKLHSAAEIVHYALRHGLIRPNEK